MPNDQELRDVVSRMVSAGEPESNIAAVIQRMSAEPSEPKTVSDLMESAYTRAGIHRTPEARAMSDRMAEGAMSGGLSSAAPTVVGEAVQAFAPSVSKALKAGGERLYSGLLKAKDATLERFPTVVQDLIQAGIPISQGGRAKVITGLKKIGAEKGELLAGADERAMIPRETLRRGLDQSLDNAIENSATPAKDMGKLAKIERELIPDEPGILPSRADKIKTSLQKEADRGYLGTKTGARVTDTAARAKMDVAGEAKQALEAIEPKLKPVNAAYASGKGQALALRDAVKRTDRHGAVGLTDILSTVGGHAVAGPVGGAAGAVGSKILSNANAGSRAAILMDRAGKIPHLDNAVKAALLALLSEQE